MCGRFVRIAAADLMGILYGLEDLPGLAPSYNLTPTESILVVRVNPESGGREAVGMRWGLVPSWAQDLKIGAKLINARSETVSEKPAFRAALKLRRCLIAMDGFYEWKRDVEPSVPWFFCLKDRKPFSIAGLWERWTDPAGKVVESCCMLTTAANELMAPVHHRMPVILDPADYALWLDPAMRDPAKLAHLYAPFPADRMTAWAVSRRVNRPDNDDPKLLDPA